MLWNVFEQPAGTGLCRSFHFPMDRSQAGNSILHVNLTKGVVTIKNLRVRALGFRLNYENLWDTRPKFIASLFSRANSLSFLRTPTWMQREIIQRTWSLDKFLHIQTRGKFSCNACKENWRPEWRRRLKLCMSIWTNSQMHQRDLPRGAKSSYCCIFRNVFDDSG